MTCRVCGDPTNDLRMGVCFDCATEGDIRLAKRSTIQHWIHGFKALCYRDWVIAKMDFRIGWERIWRTGEYAPGREWQDY